jgi:type I restriction enzyme S subunit
LRGEVLSKWVSYYANEIGREYFQREGKQTTNLASINLTKLGALPIPIAPLEEQLSVVEEIEASISGVQRMESELIDAQLRAARLRQAILANAFSGQLVPQDPNDEPARILLDRTKR